jgi:hypothetical protein
VEQAKLPAMMKCPVEPASRSILDGESPVHRRKAAIEPGCESRQIALAMGGFPGAILKPMSMVN